MSSWSPRALAIAFALSFALPLSAAVLETVAGGANPIDKPAAGTSLLPRFSGPNPGIYGVTQRNGETYFTVRDQAVVLKVDNGGILRLVAGTWGQPGTFGDGGPAVGAYMNNPSQLAFDGIGNLYISETSGNRVRKVDAFTGFISTAAGGGFSFADGVPATQSTLSAPYGIACDPAGNLYIADQSNHRVRRVDALSDEISTIAGTGSLSTAPTHLQPAATQPYRDPRALAYVNGGLYVGIYGRIQFVHLTTGLSYNIAGAGFNSSTGDTLPGNLATINHPSSFAWDAAAGTLYFAEDNDSGCGSCTARVRSLTDGYIDPVPGVLTQPRGIWLQGGSLLVADGYSRKVKSLNLSTQAVSFVAGTAETNFCCDGAPALNAMLGNPTRLALGADGKILIADYSNFRIRAFDPATGLISTVAGSSATSSANGLSGSGGTGDGGPATSAALTYVDGVAVDGQGNIYIASNQEARVRKVAFGTGIISTVAGNGSHFLGGDGVDATTVGVPYPVDVAVNTTTAQLYIAHRYEKYIRKVDLGTGIITTVAGNGLTTTALVDGNPATSTSLCANLGGIAIDSRTGDLYIADRDNARVLRVDAGTGNIYRVAGVTGLHGDSIDGPALTSYLAHPSDVDVDPATGDVYITSRDFGRVKRLSGGNLINFAGNGSSGFNGESGSPLSMRLNEPDGVLVVGSDLYISDDQNFRLRRVGISPLFTPSATPTITLTPTQTGVFSPTSTRTVTYTRTPTYTPTASPTNSPSPSASPTPGCVGGVTIGNTGSTGFDHALNGYVYYSFYQSATFSAGSVPGIWYFSGAGGGGQHRFGLYSNNAGVPNAKLTESGLVNISAGWNYIPVTPINVSAGTYWFGFVYGGGGVVNLRYTASTQPLRYVYSGTTNLPNLAGSSTLLGNYNLSIYAQLCPSLPTATLSRTPSPTQSQTWTISPTFSSTRTSTVTLTPTLTATPVCANEVRQGEFGILPSGVWVVTTYAAAQRITVTGAASLQMIRVHLQGSGSVQVKGVLYGDNGSGTAPGSLSYTGTAISAVAGWNDLPMGGTTLAPGYYWITSAYSGTGFNVSYQSSPADGSAQGYWGASAINFASPQATFPLLLAYYRYSIGAVLCTSGSPTMTPLVTATRTVTQTPTISPTWTPSPNVTGTPYCGAEIRSGNFNTETMPFAQFATYRVAQKVTLTVSASLGIGRIFVDNPAGVNLKALLYVDAAGVPGALSITSAPKAAVYGWNDVPFAGQVLNAGAYWISFVGDNTAWSMRHNSSANVGGYIVNSPNNYASPAATFGSYVPFYTYSMGVIYCPAGTPTLSPTPSGTPSASPSSSITPTWSVTPSVTPSVTQTLSITKTLTVSRTLTASPTFTPTRTVTPTRTATPTPSITLTFSETQTFTPVETPTVIVPGALGVLSKVYVAGEVDAIAVSNDKVYLGGLFTYVGPRGNAGLYNTTTSTFETFPEVLGNNVAASDAISDGNGGYFIAGNFSRVAQYGRQSVARVHGNGTVAANFSANPNGPVYSLAVAGNVLWMGGSFTQVNGQNRQNLAAVDINSGVLLPFFPNPDGMVNALTVTGSTLYMGGFFNNVSSSTRQRLAALNATNGLVDATFAPGTTNGQVFALAVEGTRLLVGGSFTQLAGNTKSRLGAVNPTTGAIDNTYVCDVSSGSNVYEILPSGSSVYLAGAFTFIGGQSRANLAATDLAGNVLTYPNLASGGGSQNSALGLIGNKLYFIGNFDSFGGVNKPSLGAVDVTTNVVDATVPGVAKTTSGYGSLLVNNDKLLIMGLPSVGGGQRTYLAALDKATGELSPFRADTNGQVFSIAVSNTGKVYVGGSFTQISGVTRNRLAALDASTGVLDTGFNPNLDAVAFSVLTEPEAIYVGGGFNNVGGTPRGKVAAVDASGVLLNWNPAAGSTVRSLVKAPGELYLGGDFLTVGGASRTRVASVVDVTGGTGYATALNISANAGIYAMALNPARTTLFVGGLFNNLGGATRGNLGAVDIASSGVTTFNPTINGVNALAMDGDTLYATGSFTTVNAISHPSIAAWDSVSQTLYAWQPGFSGGGTGMALATEPGSVHVGGSFVALTNNAQSGGYAHLVGIPTPTPIGTPTNTPSWTISPTFSASPTETPTRSITPSGTPTVTLTDSATSTATRTDTPTATETRTVTETRTITESWTISPTFSESPTSTATRTITETSTSTVTRTETPTSTESPVFTHTSTVTATPTRTVTATETSTSTSTSTRTSTPTPSVTPTWSSTSTSTVSPSASSTRTVTATPTRTPSFTATPTSTRSVSSTVTPSRTATRTVTATPTRTATPTTTRSFTRTVTATPTFTRTITGSATHTRTVTATPTRTPTLTSSASVTATRTRTETSTHSVTATSTPTKTATPTVTPSFTRSQTSTVTATLTSSASVTATRTRTETSTHSVTVTGTPTRTATPTVTPSFTRTETSTITETRTATPTATETATPNVTLTSIALSWTPTVTSTVTPPPTAVPFLQAPVTGPSVVLVPGAGRRGAPMCLATREPVTSSYWDVFNTAGQPVARLTFGSESSQCMQTNTLAVGIYYVNIVTKLQSGIVDTRQIRITIVP